MTTSHRERRESAVLRKTHSLESSSRRHGSNKYLNADELNRPTCMYRQSIAETGVRNVHVRGWNDLFIWPNRVEWKRNSTLESGQNERFIIFLRNFSKQNIFRDLNIYVQMEACAILLRYKASPPFFFFLSLMEILCFDRQQF